MIDAIKKRWGDLTLTGHIFVVGVFLFLFMAAALLIKIALTPAAVIDCDKHPSKCVQPLERFEAQK